MTHIFQFETRNVVSSRWWKNSRRDIDGAVLRGAMFDIIEPKTYLKFMYQT